MVNEDRMRHTFEDLVKIDAPSKGEREVCDYLKKKLRALGAAKITEDNNGSVNGGNSGNLIAVFNANTEGLLSIALTAHMDCVENCRGIEPVLKTACTAPRAIRFLAAMTRQALLPSWKALP